MRGKQFNSQWFNTMVLSLLFMLIGLPGTAQTKMQKNKITKAYNKTSFFKTISKLEDTYLDKQKEIQTLSKLHNWPLKEVLSDGTTKELVALGQDGTPMYYTTFNDPISVISRANSLYEDGLLNLGITGKGMQVGVWDSGVARKTHTEFGSRVSVADTSTEIGTHPTMVMGILLASGAKEIAKGVAYEATGITSDWNRDIIEVSKAAASGLLLSNHSYGIASDRVPDWYFGSYLRVSRNWDQLMYNAPYYLMVNAAGNAQKSGDNTEPISGAIGDGYDMLLGFSTSKNGITVGAVDAKIDKHGDLIKATVANYSSFGPVDDGRIKPDIAGRGSYVYTAYSKSDTSYDATSGTSMATPGITGSMLLLQQYHEKIYGSFMKAATLKGLVLHTADDVNAAGPDYQMGWGVMNTKRAAEVITHKEFNTLIKEEALAEGESYSITVSVPESQKLTASISWTDPTPTFVNQTTVNNTTAALVNDLDIRITQKEASFYPWKLNAAHATKAATKGDNKVDPFEKVEIPNAVGEYTITITHKGALTNALQHFSLVVSGVTLTSCTLNEPEYLQLTGAPETVSLEGKAIPDAMMEIQYKAVNTKTWTTQYTDKNIFEILDLQMGTSYQVRMRTFCTENVASEYSVVNSFVFDGTDTVIEDINVEHSSNSLTPSISVYPNPSRDIIQIQGDKDAAGKFEIISASGMRVNTGNMSENSISVSDLSSGMYILRIDTSKGISTTKFYKD